LQAPLGLGGVTADARTEGSMVGSLGPPAAFAAGASLAQHLKEELEGRRGVAEIPLFDLELLLDAVFDAVLFGGVLRTFDRRHVYDPTRDANLAASLAGKPWRPGMLAE